MFTSILGRQKQFVNPDWFKNYIEESNRKFFEKKLEECKKCKKETCCKKNLLEIEDLFHCSSKNNDNSIQEFPIKINIFKFIKHNKSIFLLSAVPCGLFLLSRFIPTTSQVNTFDSRYFNYLY